jgi:hypothetical protein
MTGVAIVCVRNEARHVEYCIGDLVRDGLDVVLIDHGSEDDTVSRATAFLNRGLLFIDALPWTEEFSLRAQLQRKREIAATLDHDWIVHIDADEWLVPPFPGLTMREALTRAAAESATCVNFDEFVFVPTSDSPGAAGDYRRAMCTYYFHEPEPRRLMRAWRRTAGLENVESGGHRLLGGSVRLYPRNFVLRHYIGLSHALVCQKYVGRPFDRDEIARGWHTNRIGLTPDQLRLKDSPYLRTLPHATSRVFDTSRPAPTHFWQW